MEPILKSLKETRDNAISYINHLESEIEKTKAFLDKLPSGDSLVEGQVCEPVAKIDQPEPKPKKPSKTSKAPKKTEAQPSEKPKRGVLRATVLEFLKEPRTKKEIVDHVMEVGAISSTTKNPTNSVNQILYGKGVEKQGDKFVVTQN